MDEEVGQLKVMGMFLVGYYGVERVKLTFFLKLK